MSSELVIIIKVEHLRDACTSNLRGVKWVFESLKKMVFGDDKHKFLKYVFDDSFNFILFY